MVVVCTLSPLVVVIFTLEEVEVVVVTVLMEIFGQFVKFVARLVILLLAVTRGLHASPATVNDPSWYVDSGATDHVTADLANLSLQSDYKGQGKLTIVGLLKTAYHLDVPVLGSGANLSFASSVDIATSSGTQQRCSSFITLSKPVNKFMQPANFSDMKCDIPKLRGDNYKMWKERVFLHLGWMDIDYAIRKDEPVITPTSTPNEIAFYEQWERSNRLSVMFINTKISAGIRSSVDQHTNVKALLKAIDEQFESSDKALASTLIMKFSSLRLTTVRGVREHIM
ncbi:hypothetical protein L484_018614 [Morus notabilis]|uniref:Retrotransposon Copia-like N-terminal domain-containing protein n=1 Tax=Morus notabilis TaxID=981085 RepID=W9RF86_9ROSA|nr:hypothetical protein L484_018614 [Morus notabilis]